MKQELPYFYINDSYGSCQNWFSDRMMRLGGCAAVTACDSCVYLTLHKGMGPLYPYRTDPVQKPEYLRFAMEMKPYLRPRWTGIDRLEIFTDGFGAFLRNRGHRALGMEAFSGDLPEDAAAAAVKDRINAGFPVPMLVLKHTDPELKDYVWHWFLLTGYDEAAGGLLVKAVTYGAFRWLDFGRLWNTGDKRTGGLILYRDGTKAPG